MKELWKPFVKMPNDSRFGSACFGKLQQPYFLKKMYKVIMNWAISKNKNDKSKLIWSYSKALEVFFSVFSALVKMLQKYLVLILKWAQFPMGFFPSSCLVSNLKMAEFARGKWRRVDWD